MTTKRYDQRDAGGRDRDAFLADMAARTCPYCDGSGVRVTLTRPARELDVRELPCVCVDSGYRILEVTGERGRAVVPRQMVVLFDGLPARDDTRVRLEVWTAPTGEGIETAVFSRLRITFEGADGRFEFGSLTWMTSPVVAIPTRGFARMVAVVEGFELALPADAPVQWLTIGLRAEVETDAVRRRGLV